MRAAWSWIMLPLVAGQAVAQNDTPPPFQLVRADEDYSPAANAGRYGAPPEPYKYLPLTEDGETYLSFGGEIRERFDIFDAPRFGIGTKSDAYDLQRLLLHVDFRATHRFRVFAQIGKHDVFDKRTAILPVDRSPTDIQNLFFDLVPDASEHWRLRVGRQELLLNPVQRFISVREGPNMRQSYDGSRVTWQNDGWRIDGFSLRPVIVREGAFENHGDPNTRFSGLYVSRSLGASTVLEGYWLALDRWNVRYGSEVVSERRRAAGTRFMTRDGPFDFDTDLVWEYGTSGNRDIRAWAIGSDTGFTLPVRWQPRLGLRFDSASGGSASDPSAIETFNPMFPKGLYFDESTLTTFANLVSIRPSLTLTPARSWSLQVSEAWRWKENSQDGLYLIPFVLIPQTADTPGRYVGRWTILDSLWRMNRWITVQVEYVHVAAGEVVHAARGHDVNFTMLIAQAKF